MKRICRARIAQGLLGPHGPELNQQRDEEEVDVQDGEHQERGPVEEEVNLRGEPGVVRDQDSG